MAIKVPQKDGSFKYKCSYCNKVYTDPLKADKCLEENHDIVYMQISREDAARLLKFIFFKDDRLITDTMMKSLREVSGTRS